MSWHIPRNFPCFPDTTRRIVLRTARRGTFRGISPVFRTRHAAMTIPLRVVVSATGSSSGDLSFRGFSGVPFREPSGSPLKTQPQNRLFDCALALAIAASAAGIMLGSKAVWSGRLHRRLEFVRFFIKIEQIPNAKTATDKPLQLFSENIRIHFRYADIYMELCRRNLLKNEKDISHLHIRRG